MPLSSFSPSVLTLPATSQQLELNIVTNPTAATSATDQWTVSGMTVTRNATGSPLDPLVPTGFNLSSTASSQTFTTVALTVPATLMNKKLKVEFYYQYVSGTSFTLDVLDGTDTHYNLTTDVSGTTTLPQTSGKFVAYFDSNNSTSLKVRFSSTGTGVTKFTQLIVGPGIQPQGGVVGPWQSYTPTWSGSTSWALNNGTTSGQYRQVGSVMEIEATVSWGSTTALSGTLGINLPSGFTLGTVTGAGQAVGVARMRDAGVSTYIGVVNINNTSGSSNIATIALYNNASDVSNTVPFTFGTGDAIFVWLSVPIAEWASSGTVQLAQNDVEWAYNTSTSTTASDSTSFAYGPNGAQIQSITAALSRTVRFQSPVQKSDKLVVEVSSDQVKWADAVGALFGSSGYVINPLSADGTNFFGVGIWQDPTLPSTDIKVYFGKYQSGTTASPTAWSQVATYYWRVRKSSAGASVGFGIVSSTSAGLLPISNSNLDDPTATRLGLKQYLHGTNYNGGNAPTITLNAGGGSLSSVQRGVFIPYQVQDGTWRLKFNMAVLLDAVSRTQVSLAVNGITAKNASATQAIAASANNTSAYVAIQGIDANTNIFNWYGASSAATSYRFSGDIELDSKPTWAY